MSAQSFFDTAFYIGLWAGILGVVIEGVFCAIKYHRWESHVTTVWGWYNIVYGLGATVLYILAMGLQMKSLFWKIVIMTVIVTLVELIAGLVLKNFFGMKAWDYSKQPLNIAGLICPAFSLGWAGLSLVVCLISDKLTQWFAPFTIEPLHIIAAVLFVLLAVDFVLAMMCVYRWSRRHYGKASQTAIGAFIDKYATDEWISGRFIEWKFLDEDVDETETKDKEPKDKEEVPKTK